MDCGKIRKDLHAYIGEMVTAEEKAKIEEHLASCPDCRTALAELKQTLQFLENLDEVEPPAWLTQKVMARVRAEHPAKEGFFTRLFGWIPTHLPATAVATLVIAVTAVILMKSMEPKLQESLPTSVPAPQMIPAERPAPATVTPPAPAERILQERTVGTARKKAADTGKGIAEDRMTADQEKETPLPQQAPAALRAAPEAPAVSSAPGPAAASPELGGARGRAVFKDAPQAGEVRTPARAREERAAGSLPQRVITERYPGGSPRVVVTYQNTSGRSGKVMEERFDEQGSRHGLHRSYDTSGSLTAEVLYEHGEPVSIKEFKTDGSVKTGVSERDWPWLNPDLR